MNIKSTRYVTPDIALQSLNPQHLIRKLQKSKIIAPFSTVQQQKLQEYLKSYKPGKNINKLTKYLQKLKLSDDAKQKIVLYDFSNQGEMIIIVPELNRLSQTEKKNIVELKNSNK